MPVLVSYGELLSIKTHAKFKLYVAQVVFLPKKLKMNCFGLIPHMPTLMHAESGDNLQG